MTSKLDCAALAPLLQAYEDGELAAAEREAVSAHLAGCEACRARRARETGFTEFLRARLQSDTPAPAPLLAAVRTALAAKPLPPWWARPLASPWAPRLAAAVALLAIVAVPLMWLPGRGHGAAQAAVEQHRCHGFAPGAPLPPCCTDLHVGVGARLGPPSAGAVVPDLAATGLAFVIATRCAFAPQAVNLISYRDAGGTSFSLYMTAGSMRRFKLLHARARDGVVQARDQVTTAAGRFDVCTWMQDGLVYTWVAPAASQAGEAALSLLLQAGR